MSYFLSSRPRSSLLAVVIVLLLMPGRAGAGEVQAGAHAQPISPSRFPAPVNGGMKGVFATGIHDHMYARSLAIHDGERSAIFCVADACLIPREICERVKDLVTARTGVPRTYLLLSATHTHSAATLTPAFQSDPDPEYIATVPERIAQGMIRAFENLEPAEIGWGRASEPAHVFNRRWFLKEGQAYTNPFGVVTDRVQMNPGYQNPDIDLPAGPVDPEVCVLAVRSRIDRRPLARLANYSLHYVGGNPPISADYFGAFAAEMATLLSAAPDRGDGKPAFVAILSNGTSGNINNINYGKPAPPRRMPGEQIRIVARSVANAAMRAYESITFHGETTLSCIEQDVRLKVRKASPDELDRARRILESAPKDKDGQFSDRAAIYAREAVLLDTFPQDVPVKLQAWRIGGLSITAIPCEVFVELGLELKQKTPFAQHFTISLANGYNGYLPTVQHHAWGGYETWRARSSYLEVSAADVIRERLLQMLADLAAGQSQ